MEKWASHLQRIICIVRRKKTLLYNRWFRLLLTAKLIIYGATFCTHSDVKRIDSVVLKCTCAEIKRQSTEVDNSGTSRSRPAVRGREQRAERDHVKVKRDTTLPQRAQASRSSHLGSISNSLYIMYILSLAQTATYLSPPSKLHARAEIC